MGMYTVLEHEGQHYQFKTGDDHCAIVKVGDKIDWRPDPGWPGSHIDGVYDSIGGDDDFALGPWVIIKDCVVVAAEPRTDNVDSDSHPDIKALEAKYGIKPPDPKLWSEADWAAKRRREAQAEAEYAAWKEKHGDDPCGYFISKKLTEPSFMDQLLPMTHVKDTHKDSK